MWTIVGKKYLKNVQIKLYYKYAEEEIEQRFYKLRFLLQSERLLKKTSMSRKWKMEENFKNSITTEQLNYNLQFICI